VTEEFRKAIHADPSNAAASYDLNAILGVFTPVAIAATQGDLPEKGYHGLAHRHRRHSRERHRRRRVLILAFAVSFVSPAGAVMALAGAVALVVLLAGDQRLRRVCAVVGLRPPTFRTTVPLGVAVAALTACLSPAAAKPVLATQEKTSGRADAEVYFVFDISRSMGARSGPDAPTRLDRARAVAKEIRASLGGIPAGVASLTDRLLPHLFASASVNDFNAVVDRALGVDRPPARLAWGDTLGTRLSAIGELPNLGYFSDQARRRAVVVLTDGETLTEGLSSLPAQLTQSGLHPFLVRIWGPNERVYDPRGTVNPNYRPDPDSTALFDQLANSLQTRVYGGQAAGVIARAIRKDLGKGPMTTRGRELQSTTLTPWLVGLAFLPLLYILYRRNLPRVAPAKV
jgi:hypothetical protein